MSRILFVAKHVLKDGTTREQTIISWQSFVGHVVGCWPMEEKKKLHRMINKLLAERATVISSSLYLHVSSVWSVQEFRSHSFLGLVCKLSKTEQIDNPVSPYIDLTFVQEQIDLSAP